MLAQQTTGRKDKANLKLRRNPSEVARETCSATSAIHSATAGYVAGITGVLFGHPLDSAKVWLQTNSTGQNKHLVHAPSSPSSGSVSNSAKRMTPTSSKSLSRAVGSNLIPGYVSMSTLVRAPVEHLKLSTQTIRALYSGISGPLFAVGLVQSANFTSYDTIRRILHHYDHPDASESDYLNHDSLANVAIAGFCTGSVLAFFTAPLVMVKTRQQISGKGFRQALAEILRPKGGPVNLSSCFVGFGPHLLSETLGRAFYYSTYEYCKRSIVKYKRIQGDKDASVSMSERMAAAATSGIVCWSLIFPLDSIRSRMFNQDGSNPKNTFEMIHAMYQEGGSSLRPFYRGFSVTVLRAGPVAAAVLPIYDFVLEKLSSSSS